MRTSAREKYGSGPSLSTRKERGSRLAGIMVLICIGGIIWSLLWT